MQINRFEQKKAKKTRVIISSIKYDKTQSHFCIWKNNIYLFILLFVLFK